MSEQERLAELAAHLRTICGRRLENGHCSAQLKHIGLVTTGEAVIVTRCPRCDGVPDASPRTGLGHPLHPTY